jgi:hypothetical protein
MARTAKDVAALISANDGVLMEYDPRKTKVAMAQFRGLIKYANEIKDWKLGMKAARAMVEWQTKFVADWEKDVTPGHGGDRRKVRDRVPWLSVAQVEKETGIKKQQVSHWRNSLKNEDYWKRLIRPSHNKALADDEERYELMTGETEWFTPAEYIEKVRRVLGKIDVDPASCKEAQRVVKAKRFYTRKDDGLKKVWKGTVFLNPPYEGKSIAAFSAKLLAEMDAGNVSAAIMLTNGYTDSGWFHNLGRPSNALCLTLSRIKFVSPKGDKRAPTNGQCFFYYGDKRERFLSEFEDVGMLLVHP